MKEKLNTEITGDQCGLQLQGDALRLKVSAAAGPWVKVSERLPETKRNGQFLTSGAILLIDDWGVNLGFFRTNQDGSNQSWMVNGYRLGFVPTHWAEIILPEVQP